MITHLHISNYALIDTLDIDLAPDLNIITGETGAGKSIILGALSLLMGARADRRAIRQPESKTVVEAVFDITGLDGVGSILADNDIDLLEGGECILRRELTARGSSRAFVNDTPVTANTLRQVASALVDIHSQHQNMLMTDAAYQLTLIDAVAQSQTLLHDYQELYRAYRAELDRYTQTRDMLTRNRAEAEYIAYQLEQLDALRLQPGEQADLERRRDVARNLASLTQALDSAIDAIQAAPAGMAHAADSLTQTADIYDEATDLAGRLQSARIEVQDILESVEDYRATLSADDDPDAIDERLSAIYSLEARHHVDSDTELIALRERLRSQLQTINNADPVLHDLEEKARQAKKAAVMAGRALSESRTRAAATLQQALVERAQPLGLPNMRCEIRLTQGKLTATGLDNVTLLVAFNKNQPLTEIGATASGGELSRVVMALKSIVAESMNMPTVIFDEVDTGISGDTANRVARLMHALASRQQIIAITHLPQVAAAANRHFKVYKHDNESSTQTAIELLDEPGRMAELAAMIAGNTATDAALATAKTLIDSYK